MNFKIAKLIRLLVGSAALLVGLVLLSAERMKPVIEWIKRVRNELSPLTDFISKVVDGIAGVLVVISRGLEWITDTMIRSRS